MKLAQTMEDDNKKGVKNLRNYKTKHACAFSRKKIEKKKSKGKKIVK